MFISLTYSVTSIDLTSRVISAFSEEPEANTEEILHCSFLAIILLGEDLKLDKKIPSILNSRSITTILKNYFLHI